MSLQNLPAEQLASMLEDRFKMTAVNERISAAALLRRQHEAIRVLREALEMIDDTCMGGSRVEMLCRNALKDTEEFQ